MSRVGKKIIEIPEKVEINLTENKIEVKGPKGELKLDLPASVIVKKEANQILVSVKNAQLKKDRSLWGTMRSLIYNLIDGVTQGFQKQLEINGVGFKSEVSNKNLTLNLGFSHPIEFPFPEGIDITAEKNILTITGIDKQLVGETAARIRALKKPEPYKGKGIKYTDEVIRRKAGKVVKTTEG